MTVEQITTAAWDAKDTTQPFRNGGSMKANPRGAVIALRRAVEAGNRELADFLTDEIVRNLERLDRTSRGVQPATPTDGISTEPSDTP